MTAEDRDYYELLGVQRDASVETIRHVYRRIARAYHPDANPGNPVGEERLKRITEAWETLSNPELRARYDLGLGHAHEDSTDRPTEGRGPGVDSVLSTLSPEAVRLATEQPPGWEYMLFPQALQDEIDGCAELKDAYVRGIALGPREYISLAAIQAWAEPRMKELDRLVAGIESAINLRLPPAFGEPGEAGDLGEIVAVARFVGASYRKTIEWSLRIRCAVGPPGFEAVVDALARFPDDVLAKVESAGRPLLLRAKDGIARALAGESVTIDTRLDFQLSHRLEFSAALKRLE